MEKMQIALSLLKLLIQLGLVVRKKTRMLRVCTRLSKSTFSAIKFILNSVFGPFLMNMDIHSENTDIVTNPKKNK